jgi:wobble nucleotide-excising tRNase
MVRTLNLLQNVGKFDNVATGAQLPFSRLTVIYAENAHGKTTLAAILRSLASGRTELITERARLGAPNPPHVVVDTGAGAPAVFQNGAWTRTATEIVVFDDNFVADNVCSGIEVGATHRQNLHELIVGAQGIALARALQAEVDHIEAHNRDLRERENAIPAQTRGNLSVDAFCALNMIADLPRLIEEAERRLAAARDAGRVAEMPTFPVLTLPKIDVTALRALLAKGLPDLDAGALARVQDHLRRLGRQGEVWVGEGMKLTEYLVGQGYNECPFCAQDLEASPILGHYRAYFGEAYNNLKREITDAIRDFRAAQAGDVPAAFERSVREAVERQTFWKALAEVPVVEINTAAVARTWNQRASMLIVCLRPNGRHRSMRSICRWTLSARSSRTTPNAIGSAKSRIS